MPRKPKQYGAEVPAGKDIIGDKDRYIKILEIGRRGLFQEYTTETGEVIRTGRPRKIDTVQTLDKAISDYIDYMEQINATREPGEKPYLLTIAGFCVFCGIDRETLGKYAVYNKDPEYRGRVKALQDYILTFLQQLGMNGELSTIPLMAELNNNHGYTNAPQVVRHEVIADLPTVEDIRRRLPGTDSQLPPL